MTLMDSQLAAPYEDLTPKTYLFGAVILLLGVFGVYMMMAQSRTYPLLTVFFYSVPSSVAIAIFPHEPMMIWYGRFVNLWKLTTVSTVGTILALYIDYKFFTAILNLRYSAAYKANRFYQRARYWFLKYPFWVITVAAFLPLPFYPIKFMVYSSKYSMPKYLTAVTLGRFPRYYILAWVGHVLQVPNWILIIIFVAMTLSLFYKRIGTYIAYPFVRLSRLICVRKVEPETDALAVRNNGKEHIAPAGAKNRRPFRSKPYHRHPPLHRPGGDS